MADPSASLPPRRKSLMFCLGEAVGHIARAARRPVEPRTTVVATRVQERVVNTHAGPIVLRRTTIDEVQPAEGDRREP